MAPPLTPTSLTDLPASWRLKLATTKSLARNDWGLEPAVPLFRTCAFFRDTVLQHRTAVAKFRMPIAAESFPAELARLCTVARRSSNVKLRFGLRVDDDDDDSSSAPWTRTEPHITHLLVCAMAELGGPLACVKEVHTLWLQQTALVPAWLKVCCPDVKKLELDGCRLTLHLPDLPPPAPAAAPAPPPHHGSSAPLTCQHLRRIDISFHDDGNDDDNGNGGEQWRQHIRQQMAALPSLTSLVADSEEWMREPALVSTTLTSLCICGRSNAQLTHHLAVQFPNLRRLDTPSVTLDDAGVEALLRLPHLERLSVRGFNLQRSYAHRAWGVRHLNVVKLDVAALARLPLEGIETCTLQPLAWCTPSSDAQAVARVAEAVRRWGGLGVEGGERVEVEGRDTAALLTTLGPLLAALPAEPRREVCIIGICDVTPATLQALCQQLPAGVAVLHLHSCSLQPEAWPVLLPSLPATVTELWLDGLQAPTEEQLVALCGGAVRRVRVEVRRVAADALKRVEGRLVGLGRESLVTLVRR